MNWEEQSMARQNFGGFGGGANMQQLMRLILAAVNEALRKGEEARETAMSRMAPGMGGLF